MRLMIGLLIAFVGISNAQAQNSMSPSGSERKIIDSVSANDMISMMQELGINTTVTENNADFSKVIQLESDGAVLYLALRECQSQSRDAGCSLLQPFGFFSATGVTLAQVNKFNLMHSRIALAALVNDGSGLIASKIYMHFGVSEQNLAAQIYLFFLDVDTLVSAILPGPLAEVDFDRSAPAVAAPDAPNLLGLIEDTQSKTDWVVNRTGQTATPFATDKIRNTIGLAARQGK